MIDLFAASFKSFFQKVSTHVDHIKLANEQWNQNSGNPIL